MTELTDFLTSLYDSFSEAEMQALQHGQMRLAELLGSGSVPPDVSLPVYHATDVEVTLEVGLRVEQTEEGMTVYVTESPPEDASTFVFTVELFELLERDDLAELEYDEILPPGAPSVGGEPSEDSGNGQGDGTRDEEGSDRGKGEAEREGRTDSGKSEERTGGSSGENRSGPAGVPSVEVVAGIDPAHATRLQEEGVESLSELARYSPDELVDLVSGEGADVSPERARAWIEQARGLDAVLADYGGDIPVELVDGIGPTFGSRLRESGVEELSQLVELSPEEVADLVSTESVSVSPERAADWLEEARDHRRMVAEFGATGNGGDAGSASGETRTADSTTDTEETR